MFNVPSSVKYGPAVLEKEVKNVHRLTDDGQQMIRKAISSIYILIKSSTISCHIEKNIKNLLKISKNIFLTIDSVLFCNILYTMFCLIKVSLTNFKISLNQKSGRSHPWLWYQIKRKNGRFLKGNC